MILDTEKEIEQRISCNGNISSVTDFLIGVLYENYDDKDIRKEKYNETNPITNL